MDISAEVIRRCNNRRSPKLCFYFCSSTANNSPLKRRPTPTNFDNSYNLIIPILFHHHLLHRVSFHHDNLHNRRFFHLKWPLPIHLRSTWTGKPRRFEATSKKRWWTPSGTVRALIQLQPCPRHTYPYHGQLSYTVALVHHSTPRTATVRTLFSLRKQNDLPSIVLHLVDAPRRPIPYRVLAGLSFTTRKLSQVILPGENAYATQTALEWTPLRMETQIAYQLSEFFPVVAGPIPNLVARTKTNNMTGPCFFFFRAPFSRMVQSPPKHLSGWQTVFILASLKPKMLNPIMGDLVGGRRLGPAKSRRARWVARRRRKVQVSSLQRPPILKARTTKRHRPPATSSG